MTTGIYEWSIKAISLVRYGGNSWEYVIGMALTTDISGPGSVFGFVGETGACNSNKSPNCIDGTGAKPARVLNAGDTAYFKYDGSQQKLFLREPLSSETAPYVAFMQNVPDTGAYMSLAHTATSTWELKWKESGP